MPVPVRVPAVASVALRPVLAASALHAEVLGVSSHAVWLRAGDQVVVVSTSDATRLPNSLEIAAAAVSDPFASVGHRDRASIGRNQIGFDGLVVEAVRWWDPRPSLAPLSQRGLSARVCRLPSSIHGLDGSGLREALSTKSSTGLCSAATALLGRGPGLTPQGDDYLAGAIAATRLLGRAVGDDKALAMLEEARNEVTRAAASRTTLFSSALIRHALRGEVAAPAAAFLRAVAGRGDVNKTHRRLLSVGHSSGPTLAAGIVLGARSLTQSHTTTDGGPQ